MLLAVCLAALLSYSGKAGEPAPRGFTPTNGRPLELAGASVHSSNSESLIRRVAQPKPPAPNPRHQLSASEGAWNLRWREPQVQQAKTQSSTQNAVHTGREKENAVQMASTRLAVRDPFDDPFGDGPEPILPEAGRQPVLEEMPAPQFDLPHDPSGLDDADDLDLQPQFPDRPSRPRVIDPAPLPPEQAPPVPGPPAFDPLTRPRQDPADGEMIYNQRDCRAELEGCQDARDFVRRNPITTISLDITPTFRPDRPELEEELQRDRLAEAPSRTWRDRDGQVVAIGRLVDYEWGRVVIQEEDRRLQQIPARDLSDEDLCFVNAFWDVPSECPLEGEFVQRNWLPMTMTWKASALCHKPLYFEQVQLERYGHTTGPLTQPFVSGAHFFVNIAFMPYKMGMNPPTECRYPLGYYRPGSCAPWLLRPLPISLRGAAAQTGAVLGGAFLLP